MVSNPKKSTVYGAIQSTGACQYLTNEEKKLLCKVNTRPYKLGNRPTGARKHTVRLCHVYCDKDDALEDNSRPKYSLKGICRMNSWEVSEISSAFCQSMLNTI